MLSAEEVRLRLVLVAGLSGCGRCGRPRTLQGGWRGVVAALGGRWCVLGGHVQEIGSLAAQQGVVLGQLPTGAHHAEATQTGLCGLQQLLAAGRVECVELAQRRADRVVGLVIVQMTAVVGSSTAGTGFGLRHSHGAPRGQLLEQRCRAMAQHARGLTGAAQLPACQLACEPLG